MKVERRRNESQQPSFDDLFADSDIFDDDDEPISDDDMSAMSDMLDFDDDSFDIDSAFQDQQEQAGDQPSRRKRGKRGGRGGRNRKRHAEEDQQPQTAGGDEELDISDLFGDDIDGMFGDGGSGGMGSIDDLFGDDDDDASQTTAKRYTFPAIPFADGANAPLDAAGPSIVRLGAAMPPRALPAASMEAMTLQLLAATGMPLSRTEIETTLQLDKNRSTRILRNLEHQGKVIRQGRSRATRYRLA